VSILEIYSNKFADVEGYYQCALARGKVRRSMENLGRNLAVAGALSRSFELGCDAERDEAEAMYSQYWYRTEIWYPNIDGEPAP